MVQLAHSRGRSHHGSCEVTSRAAPGRCSSRSVKGSVECCWPGCSVWWALHGSILLTVTLYVHGSGGDCIFTSCTVLGRLESIINPGEATESALSALRLPQVQTQWPEPRVDHLTLRRHRQRIRGRGTPIGNITNAKPSVIRSRNTH